MNECSLGVHEIEFMVESRPSLGNGGGVADHADCAGNLGDVGARYCSWRLVVDTDLME